MPMAYGLGCVYRFSDNFYISGDIYQTNWNELTHINEMGDESNPTTEKPPDKSHMNPTRQLRIGSEYLFVNPHSTKIIALRGGIFYDPLPSIQSQDDCFGFSLGFGYTKNDLFSLDMAYQFRFADNANEDLFEYLKLSETIREHKIYFSVILYLL